MTRNSLLLAAGLSLLAQPVLAQDFLGRMARAAAERAVAGAVSSAISSASGRTARPADAAPAAPTPAGQRQAPASTSSLNFAPPAPINYRPDLPSVRSLEFAPADAEGKRRLMDFSRYSCSDCEGGRSFGSWVGDFVPSLWGDDKFAAHVGGMSVGQTIEWQVPQMGGSGRIEVVGEHPVGEWPCKQLRWTMTRAEGSAERMGLVCYGPRGAGTAWDIAL